MNEEVKKIRILRVQFNGDLAGHEIPAFRGAIVDKVGNDNILFHNHLGKDVVSYKYPLIQYKNINGSPAIICVEHGVDEIHKFFQNEDWSLKISERVLDMSIDSLSLNKFTMQVWDRMWKYRIKNWVALNKDNYTKYTEIKDEKEKLQMLENILKANILSFAKGINWTVSKPIKIVITSPIDVRPVKVKGNKLIAFNLRFETNVFIPNFIGLGKGVSRGYGVVSQVKNI